MKNKGFLRSVAFVLLLVIALCGVMQCYGLPASYDTKNLATIDGLDKNMLDGIVIGTSVVGYSWNTPAVWWEYGMALGHAATSIQAFGAIPGLIDFVRKTQDIKYVVVDVHGLRKSTIMASLEEVRFRSAYLNVPDLISQYKILDDLFDYAEEVYDFYGEPTKNRESYVDLSDKSYYLPIIDFHSRWTEGLVMRDFVTVESNYLGALERAIGFQIKDCTKYLERWDFDTVIEPDDFQKKQLDKLFEYGKENNIEFLFMSLPSFQSMEEQQELAGLLEYCAANGYNTLDFGTREMLTKVGINLKTDFCNAGHLNSRGGIKTSKYVSKYLKDNGYYTPDHRGEEKYSEWDTIYKKYAKFYKKNWGIITTQPAA